MSLAFLIGLCYYEIDGKMFYKKKFELAAFEAKIAANNRVVDLP